MQTVNKQFVFNNCCERRTDTLTPFEYYYLIPATNALEAFFYENENIETPTNLACSFLRTQSCQKIAAFGGIVDGGQVNDGCLYPRLISYKLLLHLALDNPFSESGLGEG
jgi:hypothetical protein